MSGSRHTPYHPKWYRRRVSVWWWLLKWPYARFVLRELTSVFVAIVALGLLWEVRALGQGIDAHARFVARLRSPLFVALNIVTFVAVLFHAISWCNLAPTAMVVRLKGRRVPDAVVRGANYAAWLMLSGAVAVLLTRG